jgi:superkiller protein 3
LRNSPRDVHAWVGLGEAYASSGRYSAALKSFARAETLDRTKWYPQYILGNVQKDVLEYDLACETFRKIMKEHPTEFVVALALSRTLIAWAYGSLRSGYFSRSVELATQGVNVALRLVNDHQELSEAWKLIGDGAYLASLVRVEGSVHLSNTLAGIFHLEERRSQTDSDTENEPSNGEESDKLRLLRDYVAAMEMMAKVTEGDRLAHSAAKFNLGLAKYRLLSVTSGLKRTSVKLLIEDFRDAIRAEPRTFEYWNALGVVTAVQFPVIAEKAFSRALQINERVDLSETPINVRVL